MRSNLIQSSALSIVITPWKRFCLFWTQLGIQMMKERGYACIWLHDETQFVKMDRHE